MWWLKRAHALCINMQAGIMYLGSARLVMADNDDRHAMLATLPGDCTCSHEIYTAALVFRLLHHILLVHIELGSCVNTASQTWCMSLGLHGCLVM